MIDVLMYLFENYFEAQLEQDTVTLELSQAGFEPTEIQQAFRWLDGIVDLQNTFASPTPGSLRHYLPHEVNKLNLASRGFLLFIEQLGILTPAARETVIDRAMALEFEEIDLSQLKWVVLMVLLSQPEQQAALAWMENFVHGESKGQLH
jgi:Smg protein